MNKIIRIIGSINTFFGNVVGWISFLMVLIVVYEVVARYVFNAPTLWSMEINQYLFCAVSLLAGGVCFLKDDHVRVDVLYPKMSPKVQAWVEILIYPLALALCGVLLYFGGGEFWRMLVEDIRSETVLAIPLWPVYLMIPVGAFLLFLQIVARYLGNINVLMGKDRE